MIQDNNFQALLDRLGSIEGALGVGPNRRNPDPYGQNRGRLGRSQQQVDEGEQETQALSRWNPSGAWPNPLAPRFGGANGYRPHEFIAALAGTPQADEYLNPEGVAAGQGAEGLAREGSRAKTDARRRSKAQGLGRGFAAAADTEIDSATRAAGAEMMTAAHLEGAQRRFSLAAEMARALAGANEARFTDYLSERAAAAAEDAGDSSLLGGIFGGLGSIIGAAI